MRGLRACVRCGLTRTSNKSWRVGGGHGERVGDGLHCMQSLTRISDRLGCTDASQLACCGPRRARITARQIPLSRDRQNHPSKIVRRRSASAPPTTTISSPPPTSNATETAGNERVPKITINDTTRQIYFLNCNQHFDNFKP